MIKQSVSAFAFLIVLVACSGDERSAVTELGIGALKVGMTVAEARKVLASFDVPAGSGEGCEYATVTGLPPGVRVMVESGTIARIDIDTSLVPTVEGARVGDSEASVVARYGKRLTVSPHKYTDGHYLTVRPSSPVDTPHRIVFETDKGRVVKYRAGRLPQVEYVEGCS